jgi:teichuronic acid exporter
MSTVQEREGRVAVSNNPPRSSPSTLRSKVLSGLFWVGAARLLTQAFTWAITIVVIRLLHPSDYGLLAMAMLFGSFLVMLAEAGLRAALVQAPHLDELKLRRVFGAVILIAFGLFLVQLLAAPAIAHFFEEDRLVAIIRVLSVQFLLMIFAIIPNALLARRLDFKGSSLIAFGAAACGSVSTLLLALSGHGVWALVLGNLAAALFSTVLINFLAPFFKRPDFSFRDMREFFVFSGQVTAAVILRFLYAQADIFIAGKVLGKELLGLYSVSMHLASLPVQRISAAVNQVAYPVFAHAQHRLSEVPAYILKGVRLLSFFSFPVMWGLSSISGEIVSVLLGPKWQEAAVPLQLVPLVMPLTMLSPFLNTAFQAIGRPGVVLANVFTAFLLMPLAFWLGIQWGLFGLSMAWLLCFPLVFLINLWRMLPLVGLKLPAVIAAIARPAIAAGGMYACVAVARNLLSNDLTQSFLMMALVVTGICSHAILTLLTNRDGAREVIDLFRRREAASVQPSDLDISATTLKNP